MRRDEQFDFVELSRAISHALRHEPWLYELELDEEGAVPVAQLLIALRRVHLSWDSLQDSDVGEMIARSEKKRHELKNGKIRALYGHSVQGRLRKNVAAPPSTLYHGTTSKAVDSIMEQGLRPMGRQYVHLSVDAATAERVGARKAVPPVVLQIRAREAHARGAKFYEGNELVWLADEVVPEYIDRPSAQLAKT